MRHVIDLDGEGADGVFDSMAGVVQLRDGIFCDVRDCGSAGFRDCGSAKMSE